jgi:hypothetical protein
MWSPTSENRGLAAEWSNFGTEAVEAPNMSAMVGFTIVWGRGVVDLRLRVALLLFG